MFFYTHFVTYFDILTNYYFKLYTTLYKTTQRTIGPPVVTVPSAHIPSVVHTCLYFVSFPVPILGLARVAQCIANIMADSEGSQPLISSSNLTTAGKKATSERKEYFARRDATRVCLLEANDRWKAVKEENNFNNDRQVAKMLLDFYARESTKKMW